MKPCLGLSATNFKWSRIVVPVSRLAHDHVFNLFCCSLHVFVQQNQERICVAELHPTLTVTVFFYMYMSVKNFSSQITMFASNTHLTAVEWHHPV